MAAFLMIAEGVLTYPLFFSEASATRDAYNGISNPMDSNPSVSESKNQSYFEYLDSK